jgi:N-[(2S)-2-amino-2-carboxyethyl]-L-glutamate dehydrogenase
MHNGNLLVIKGSEVVSLLEGHELEIIEVVRSAYQAHGRGQSSLPHSLFLRFPDDQRNRIIALPAYLGHEGGVAGLKWISSFPGNVEKGLDRASAVVILNSPQTGRPEVLIEGSVISAKRTAASAALSARCLRDGREVDGVGVIGCGLINFEVVRFLRALYQDVKRLVILDLHESRAQKFKDKCQSLDGEIEVEIAGEVDDVFRRASVVSIATTATRPHIDSLPPDAAGSTILHVSLRDLTPKLILECDNVVDDIDHVCRAQTSTHLAEQLVGNRDFIRCTLTDVIDGSAKGKRDDARATVFSPFGLGILDIAVGNYVAALGREQGVGVNINSFLPDSWVERS